MAGRKYSIVHMQTPHRNPAMKRPRMLALASPNKLRDSEVLRELRGRLWVAGCREEHEVHEEGGE